MLVDESTVPFYRIKDLKSGRNEQFIKADGAPKGALVQKDELIYTRTGSLGLVFRGFTGAIHNNSFKVSPCKDILSDYLFWWLQHEGFKAKIVALASRAAQPDITPKLFKKQDILVPPISEQAEIYQIIENLNQSIQSLRAHYRAQLTALDDLKQSLLARAFAGEL